MPKQLRASSWLPFVAASTRDNNRIPLGLSGHSNGDGTRRAVSLKPLALALSRLNRRICLHAALALTTQNSTCNCVFDKGGHWRRRAFIHFGPESTSLGRANTAASTLSASWCGFHAHDLPPTWGAHAAHPPLQPRTSHVARRASPLQGSPGHIVGVYCFLLPLFTSNPSCPGSRWHPVLALSCIPSCDTIPRPPMSQPSIPPSFMSTCPSSLAPPHAIPSVAPCAEAIYFNN